MNITAKELYELDFKNLLIVKVRGKTVSLDKNKVFMPEGNSEDKGETVEVVSFLPDGDSEDVYCKPDTVITLDEAGCGIVEVYLDMYDWRDVNERTATVPITVRAIIPFTDAIRTKMLLGAV